MQDSLLLSRMRACTISKNAQTSGAEAIFVWAQPWRDHSFLRCGYLCSETPTRLFRVYQQAVEGTCSWSFSVFAAFAVHASCLYIYLAHMDRQSFLAHDGIQTLDMLSLGFGPNKDRFSSWRPISDACTCTNKVAGHWWFNGKNSRLPRWEIRVQFLANARTSLL